MVRLTTAGACVIAALMLIPSEFGWARPSLQSPASQSEAHAGTAAQPPPPQPAAPETRRESKKKRTRRTSTRQPASARPSTDERRRTRDPGPVREELTVTSNVLGGYDSNLTAGLGTGAGSVPTAMASGSTAYGDAMLDYFRGNALHSIEVGSSGSLRAYPGYLEHPAPAGVVTADARTTVGQQTLKVWQRVGYEPLFTVFSPGASTTPLPPAIGQAAPATGLFERRSASSNTSVSLDRQWTRRDVTTISYSYQMQHFTDDGSGDNSAHDVLTEYRRTLSKGIQARAQYRYVNGEYMDYYGFAEPTREHRVEGGPEIDKILSRRQHLTLSLGAGASHIESSGSISGRPYRSWVPVGSGSATFYATPLWSIEGGYRRGFSLLRGITDDVYTTDTTFVTTGGPVAARTDLRVGATYSHWQTPLVSGVDARFTVYGASAQIGVAVGPTVAATAGYFYYHHNYSDPGGLPVGFPAEYDRHAVFFGLRMWIPLAGTPRPPAILR